MSPAPDVSSTRQRAVELSGDGGLVMGPLKGYHHETYVVPWPRSDRVQTFRTREPRAEILWFDRRCFRYEEELLRALMGRITRIPDVVDIEGMRLQRFIEGQSLGACAQAGRRLPDTFHDQIVDLFREMARITPDTLHVERRCSPEDRAEDGDTDGFLKSLIGFVETQVYGTNHQKFGELFRYLGVDSDSFARLREHVSGLSRRPFSLLHADLHRENFIVDPERRLWTIDWELAMVGDPLYDLATHLYLMRYPVWQGRRTAKRWRTAIEEVRPGSTKGMEDDLDRLLDYKRAQSVFTDVIREAMKLGSEQDSNGDQLVHSGLKLRRILTDAAGPLGLDHVPSLPGIMTALRRWCRAQEVR